MPSHATATTPEIFRQMTTTKSAEIGKVAARKGLFRKIGEVEAMPTYVPKIGNKWTVTMSDWGDSIELSKNLWDDDQFGEVQDQIRSFAKAARDTQDYNAFGIYRNAFTTTLTADGVSLINIAHPLLSGGTQSNQIVTADISGATTSALTTASFNVAMRRMATMKDQSGLPFRGVGNVLLVPTALYMKARQIVQSSLVPEDSLNAVNIFTTDYSVKVYQSVWIDAAQGGSDTAWFLLDSSRHSIRRYVRQGLETYLRPWGQSNDRTYNYQANFREELIALDYSGVVAATGLA